MFWIKIIKSIIKQLQSDISPNQLAGGMALGSIIGLTPFMCLHNYLVFLLIFLLQVNIGSAFAAIGIFSFAGLFLDPLSHKIGYLLLVKTEALSGFWTALYNMPVIPFTKFYNTVVLGSLIISIILFFPVFFGAKKFVVAYRIHLRDKIQNWKVMKWFKMLKIYNFYKKFFSSD